MSLYAERISKIVSEFEGDDKKRVVDHYVLISRRVLLDEREVRRSKIDLVHDLCDICGDKVDELIRDVLDHKILQIRALVLDLIESDYTEDYNMIYGPEEWIKQIIIDAENTFDLESEFGRQMFVEYNKRLLDEFCNIFISRNHGFGSSGNQLLLNLYHYRRFVLGKIGFDFEYFFNVMRSGFREENFKTSEEIEAILNNK